MTTPTNLEITSPQQRAARWGRVAAVIAFMVLAFFVAPFIGLAIKGALGLIAFGVIAIVGLALLPVIQMIVSNLRLKLIKGEAARNPVETLQNEFLRRQGILVQKRQAIQDFNTRLLTFKDQVASFKKEYPEEAGKYQEMADKMEQLLELRNEKYAEATKDLKAFGLEIKKADAIWQMSQAAAAAGKGDGSGEDDFYAQLKVQTSMGSIQDQMNASFAQLDTLLLEKNESTLKLPSSATNKLTSK